MASSIYGMSPIVINGTTYPVESLAMPRAIVQKYSKHSGNEFPTLSATSGANPSCSFKMPLAAAFSLIGLSALPVTQLDVYLALFANLVRSPSAVHPKMSLAASASAYMHITGWDVNADDILMADIEAFYLSSDGVTHPIAAPTTAALPVLSAQPQLHTLGPLKVNGTLLAGNESHGCQLGQVTKLQRNGGCLYPLLCARLGAAPKLTGGYADPVELESILGYQGINITSSVVQYYRSYSLTTGLVSLANAISVTVASGRINPTSLGVSQDQMAKEPYEVECLSSSATNPLAINLADTSP